MAFQDIRPPDLEMRVRTVAEQGKIRLRFSLHSPNGTVALAHRDVEGPLLQRNPEDYRRHLLSKVENLGERRDVDRSRLLRPEITSRLESLGRSLWSELFSPELQTVYRDVIRPSVRSWVIVSDEPWIPWELVKPYDTGRPGEPLDDEPLCLRFELTRWLAGATSYAPEISIRRLAVVVSAPDLPHASREAELFARLQTTFPGLAVEKPQLASASHALAFLASSGWRLVHFIGHGTPARLQPDEAGIPFPDRSVLRPADLHGPLATRLGQGRPLVFLNTCWAGKEGWSLTRLGGWAARWIEDCGCGAFVAPLWPARDQAAVIFSWAFYEALAQGRSLGEASLQARRRVVDERPGDPSACAYTVYGHPNARVLFAEPQAEPGAPNRRTQPPDRAPWVPPGPRIWHLRLAAAGTALAFGGLLHFTAPSVTNRFLAIDPAWTAPGQTVADLQPRKPPAPSPPPSSNLSVGGVHFQISGGSSALRFALGNALRQAAAALEEQGSAAGWTVRVELGAAQTTPVSQGGLTQQSCTLSAQASAHRADARLDLGPIQAVNAQFTGSKACEAATRGIANAVLSRLSTALPQEGEP